MEHSNTFINILAIGRKSYFSFLFPPQNLFQKKKHLRKYFLKNVIFCTRINRSGDPSSSLPKIHLKKTFKEIFCRISFAKYSKKYYILHPNKPIWASILFPPVSIFGQSYICLFQIAIPKVNFRITIPKVIILLTSISMVQYLNSKELSILLQ